MAGFYGVEDALQNAALMATGQKPRHKGTGLAPPSLGIVTSTGQAGTPPAAPTIDPTAGLQTSTASVSAPPKPAPPPVRGSRRLIAPGTTDAPSPVNDALRATPGSIEHIMRGVDAKYSGDPDYQANRDKYVYRLQRIADHSMKADGSPYTIAEAVGLVGEDLANRKANARDVALEKAGKQPSLRKGNGSQLPAFRRADAGQLTDQELSSVDSGTLTDVFNRHRAQARAAAEQGPMVTTPGDTLSGAIGEASDYSRVFGKAGNDLVPAVSPNAPGPLRALHNIASGIVAGVNVPGALGGMADIAKAFNEWSDARMSGDKEKADRIEKATVGADGWDVAGNILGLLAGGKTMHVGTGAMGEFAGLAKGAHAAAIDETLPSAPHPASEPVASPPAPEPHAPPAEIAPVPEEPPVAPTRKGSRPAPEANPQAGKRPELAKAIEAATSMPEETPQVAGMGEAGTTAKGGKRPPMPKLGEESLAQHPQGGDWHPVEHALVPLDELKASNDHVTGADNPDYTFKDLQNKDRSAQASKEQVIDHAVNLDKNGEVTTDFHSTEKGAPIVGEDGMVESGNGRVMAMNAARDAANPRWQDYQARIKAAYGDAAAGMKDPVLVRRRVGAMTPEERVQFANDANGNTSLAKSKVESAQIGAASLPDSAFDNLSDAGGGVEAAVRSPQNAEFVQTMLDRMDPNVARQAAHDPVELGNQAKNAILSKVLGKANADVLKRLVTDGDFGKRIQSGLERSAIPLVKATRAIESGTAPDSGLQGLLGEALRVVDDYRVSDNKAGYWSQARLDAPDPAAMRLAESLVKAPSQAAVDDVLHSVARRVVSDGGLFEDAGPLAKTTADLVDHLKPQAPDSTGTAAASERLPEGATATPQPVKGSGRIVRPSLEAAGTDIKTLALVGGAAALGVAGVAAYGKQLEDWYRTNGLAPIAEAGVLGIGAMAMLYGVREGKLSARTAPDAFRLTKELLNPAEIARRAMKGDSAVERLFGEGVDALVSAKAEHSFRVADSMQRIGKAAKDAFGDANWLKSKAFQDGNETVRDLMEKNVSEGRDWHEGLSPQWRKFVGNVIPVMDKILSDFEDHGGRIRVVNDGTQHLKLAKGDSLRVAGGYGEYLGPEFPDAGDPTDPFTKAGGFGTRKGGKPLSDVNANARRNLRVAPDAQGTPTLLVKMEDGTIRKIAPGQPFGRPVDRIGSAFVPRVFKDSFVKTLQTLGAAPDGFKTALQAMLQRENPGLGISGDQMMGKLGDLAAGAESADGGIASFLANLEKERVMDLSKFEWTDIEGETHTVDPYVSSYIDSVAKYVDKGSKRVAIAAQFGPDPRALGGALTLIKARNAQYGAYLERQLGLTLGIGPETPKGDWVSRFSKGEGAYQTITKLTGGTTVLSQLNDALYSVTRAGLPTVAKAAYDLAFGADKAALRNEADVLAAVHENWQSDLRNGASDPSFRRGFIDATMTVTGLKAMDATMKRLAAVVGLRDATQTLDAAAAAQKAGKPVSGELMRKLDRYGISDRIDAAAATSAKDAIESHAPTLQRVAASTREQLTYSGASEDLPLWASHPGWSIVARLKKPLYVSTRFLLDDVVGEMAKGNLKPAARFLAYGTGGGALITYLKDSIAGKGLDGETRRLLSERKYEEGLARMLALPAQNTTPAKIAQLVADKMADRKGSLDLMGVLSAAAQNLYDAGGLGIPGELTSMNRRMQGRGGSYAPKVWEANAPASVKELQDFANRVVGAAARVNGFRKAAPGAVQAGDDLAKQQATKVAFDQLRSSVVIVRKMMDWTGLKPDVTKLSDLQRRLDKGERLTGPDASEYARLNIRVNGRFAQIEGIARAAKPPSQQERIMDAAGFTASGAPKGD